MLALTPAGFVPAGEPRGSLIEFPGFLRGHRVGSSMPDDSLRSHARWSLRVAVFLTTFREIIFRLKSVPAMTGCRLHRLFRHADFIHFLCIVEPKKVGQRNLRIAPFGRDYHAVAAKHGTAPTCGNPCETFELR